MKARCTCGQLFDFTPTTVEKGDYHVTYAECDCGKRYFSNITNTKIRKRLNRTQSIKPQRRHSYIEDTRSMMKKLEEEQEELISEIIGWTTQYHTQKQR